MKKCTFKHIAFVLSATLALSGCTQAEQRPAAPAETLETAEETQSVQAIAQDEDPEYALEALEDVPVIPPEILAGLEQAKRDAPLKPYLSCTEENEDASIPEEKYKCAIFIEHETSQGTSSIVLHQNTGITYREPSKHILFELHQLSPDEIEWYQYDGITENVSNVWAPPENLVALQEIGRPIEIYIQPILTKYGTVLTLETIYSNYEHLSRPRIIFQVINGEIIEVFRDYIRTDLFNDYAFTDDGFIITQTEFGSSKSKTIAYEWTQTDNGISVVEIEGESR